MVNKKQFHKVTISLREKDLTLIDELGLALAILPQEGPGLRTGVPTNRSEVIRRALGFTKRMQAAGIPIGESGD